MTYEQVPLRFTAGQWTVDATTGEICRGETCERLEPKTMELLRLLAARAGQVVSREQIMAAIWPDVVVADDALARTLFKLRRALGDDAKSARYVETLPKRGYRLIANVTIESADAEAGSVDTSAALPETVTPTTPASLHPSRRRLVVIACIAMFAIVPVAYLGLPDTGRIAGSGDSDRALLERADDHYYQYSRADNEAAIELYERILLREPDRVEALRGLANAMTQRMIRWPDAPRDGTREFRTLTASLRNGHLAEPPARRNLERAELLARRAIAMDPEDGLSHRALGLVLATQSHFDKAIAEYRAAIALDADAWGAMINLSEALDLTGHADAGTEALIDAHAAMTRRYASDKQHILPYYTDLAVMIGSRLDSAGHAADAESWFRRALAETPLHPGASVALAQLLDRSGRHDEALSLCASLNARVRVEPSCAAILERSGQAVTHPAPS